jgi:hypothetical protein
MAGEADTLQHEHARCWRVLLIGCVCAGGLVCQTSAPGKASCQHKVSRAACVVRALARLLLVPPMLCRGVLLLRGVCGMQLCLQAKGNSGWLHGSQASELRSTQVRRAPCDAALA